MRCRLCGRQVGVSCRGDGRKGKGSGIGSSFSSKVNRFGAECVLLNTLVVLKICGWGCLDLEADRPWFGDSSVLRKSLEMQNKILVIGCHLGCKVGFRADYGSEYNSHVNARLLYVHGYAPAPPPARSVACRLPYSSPT